MSKFIKVRVTREVLSKTATGIKTGETFRFPLDNEIHHFKFMEFACNFQVASFNDDLSKAVIHTEYDEIRYKKDGFMNYISTKIEPRFLFFAYFELVEEDYEEEKLDNYELAIKEYIYRGDTYSSHEDEKEYIVPTEVDKTLYLELTRLELVVAGVNIKNTKVLATIGDEEVEITLEKPGEYSRGGQSGYNDSFEAWNNKVTVTLKKK